MDYEVYNESMINSQHVEKIIDDLIKIKKSDIDNINLNTAIEQLKIYYKYTNWYGHKYEGKE